MADIYLSSVDGNDADDGSTWALAKATLAAALTAAGAGGRVFVDHSHAETTASPITLASPGTGDSPSQILCVDRTGNPEPPTALATTATVASTGVGDTLLFTGSAYCYGISFFTGSTTNAGGPAFVSAAIWWWRFQSCNFTMVGTSVTGRMKFGVDSAGSDEQLLELINTTLTFASVSQAITLQCPLIWENTPTALGGATFPTILFVAIADGNPGFAKIRGVDLSGMGSGKSLVGVGSNIAFFEFQNCKLGSSVAAISGTIAEQGGEVVRVVNCDSGDTNYRYEKYLYQGSIVQESVIVRTGGASDGTTPISRKMVSSANSKLFSPLESDPIIIWDDSPGAKTATIEVVTDNVTLTDKEAWIEVEYLGTSGFPLSLFATDRASLNNSFLGTGSNQASSTETWTTTGLTTPVKQKFVASFTTAEKGPIKIKVMLAKASTTMYFCPKVAVA